MMQMARITENRNEVITDKQTQVLANYLGFRHFYRHSYSHFLDWDELEKLVASLETTWADLKPQLLHFANSLAK